ncbi:MAG TPA: sulfotransferase [Acidimicrobiales bacterium]|nr:sulfotransferase [Acidimicrobiales bacterium]
MTHDAPAHGPVPPIFVVGCPRSGTTLLRVILDSHPSISCGPESRFLWGMKGIEERNWSTLSGFGLSLDEWHANVRSLFEAFHRRYAEHQHKARWADKSPDYALMLDYIDTLYPDALIVHIVRDPRDVIDAWRRFYGPKSVVRAARSWVRYVRSAHEFAADHGQNRVIELRYEDLVSDPEKTLRTLFGFLGEPWDDGVLHFADRPHRVGAEALRHDEKWEQRNAEVRTSSIGVGHRASTALPFVIVRRTGADLLTAFGYAET